MTLPLVDLKNFVRDINYRGYKGPFTSWVPTVITPDNSGFPPGTTITIKSQYTMVHPTVLGNAFYIDNIVIDPNFIAPVQDAQSNQAMILYIVVPEATGSQVIVRNNIITIPPPTTYPIYTGTGSSVIFTNTSIAATGGCVIVLMWDTYASGFRLVNAPLSSTNNLGNMLPLVPPPVANQWTFANQGTAAVSNDMVGSVTMIVPPSATQNLRLLYKTIPTAPYTVTFGFLPVQFTQYSGDYYGVALYNSGSGKAVSMLFQQQNATIQVIQNADLTHLTTVVLNNPNFYSPTPVVWLQIKDDGTNRKWRASGNGDPNRWNQVYSELNNVYIVPDKIGWVANETGNLQGFYYTLVSYQETQP